MRNKQSKLGRIAGLILMAVLSGKTPARSESMQYWNKLRQQPYLDKKVLDFGSSPDYAFSEFTDRENKGRGFRVYQFTNSKGNLVELYDFERDGFLGSPNADADNTIDNVVVSNFSVDNPFIYREAEKQSDAGRQLYREATKKFMEKYASILQRKENRQDFSSGVLN